MTCRDVAGYLLEYSANELDSGVRGEVDAHVVGCANCAIFAAQYQGTIRAARKAFETDAAIEVPAELRDFVVSQFQLP